LHVTIITVNGQAAGGRRGRPAGARPLIGMVTSGPLMEMAEEQWLGVSDAAQANDCDLICFVGREVSHPDRYRRFANAIYDLIPPAELDALVVWTTRIGLLLTDAELADFLRRFEPVPLVAVEQPAPGAPTVLMDNRGGMDQAVSHLIEVHGRRRIAFIRGPDSHSGAQLRYAGYLDALARHGLPVDPELVSMADSWNWNPDAAADAVTKMLDRLTVPPDAVAAANDDYALGVLAALESAGIRTPDDVAVVGYDNHTNIRSHDLGYEVTFSGDRRAEVQRRVNVNAGTLELTTVRAPFHEMGWRALELALARVRGEPVPEVQTMPTELVIRGSCGCFSSASGQPTPAQVRIAQEPNLVPETVAAGLREALGTASANLPDGWAERLVTGFLAEVYGRVEGAFLPLLAGYVRTSLRAGAAAPDWLRGLFGLRRLARSSVAGPAALAAADDLWLRVQLLLEQTTERLSDYRHLLDEKRDQTVREAGQRLIAARDVDELATALVEELPKLGIPGCGVSVYGALDGFDDPGPATPEGLRPVLRYEDGQRVAITAEPAERPGPYSLVAQPLYVVEGNLGVVLFELGPRLGWIYEAMQEQVSGALRGVLFVQRERRAVEAVEDARSRLERAHAELELRVEERTAELARANRILTEEIAERVRAEQRQASLENQLRHAQKMEAIGRLAGGVAHDFNNLLTVINGNSDSLLRTLATDDPNRPEVEDIRYAGERAANLTNQLLAFTRQQVLHPGRLDLNKAVANIQAMLRRLIGEDIELTATLPPDVPAVWADAGQVEQIIFNLVANARDAMPGGGVLSIETGNAHLSGEQSGRLVGVPPGDYVMLRIRDTGVGMDETVQANVFEPFFTTKPPGKGTGLGLATVFGIVQHSGGQLTLTSAPGEGTTFEIFLPRAPAEVPTTTEAPRPDSPGGGGSETILLVEDDAQVRAVTRRFLARHGYQILEADDGHHALLVARGHPGPINLVITDVVMPRMGGPQFIKQLEEIRPGNAVLYISGYTDGYVDRERLAGATVALLKKPFSEEALLRRVRALLDLVS
jgi:signal transduction histidine kinase/DNA-binding LacI/PurR family transcriptional regulator